MKITCGIYLYNTLIGKLLVCHATHARWNQWSIPKGLMEKGEDLFEVAKRELMEETGIDLDKLNVNKVYSLPSVKYQKQNKLLESFLVITDTDIEHHDFHCNAIEGKDSTEIDSWKWIALDQAQTWLHESQQRNLKLIEEFISSTLI
jgi:8-oxo-dGTP pyrophosphatase MutT (NUDIX family)